MLKLSLIDDVGCSTQSYCDGQGAVSRLLSKPLGT